MTTVAQHLAMYETCTVKAAEFASVAGTLRAGGDEQLADQVQSYADGYTRRAGDAVLAAAEAVRAEREGG